jgi:septal ring factor EnvC (AmiA/AmiB activator)
MPVNDVFRILVPVGILLGIGIGALGSFFAVRKHASKLLVSAGTHVTKGQKIALMGTTGDSDGVHLHFDVRYNGSYVSPWNYLSK